jgi:hypothetical protein
MVRKNYFLHLIFYESRFRLALLMIGLVLLTAVALAPKLWITSPPHLDETVRVSGMDLLQSWNLKRTARKEEALGRPSEAISAWIGAIGNNPADLEAIRGFLQAVIALPKPDRAYLGTGVGQAKFLLRLTRTNRSDLTLASDVHRHYELFPQTLALLDHPNEPLETKGLENQVIALFETGRMEAFGQVWSTNRSVLSERPVAALYHAAWAAGWGPIQELSAGRTKIFAAAEGGEWVRIARRLLLTLHFSQLDLASYRKVLNQLQDTREARVQDEVRFWILLEQSGKHDRAVELARQHTVAPETAPEAEMLILAWKRLGLTDIAIEFARQQMTNFAYHPGIWTALADLLVQTQNWDELAALALELRTSRLREGYAGWSLYLEGMADHHRNRSIDAADQFAAAATNSFQDPLLAFSSAAQMRRMGYPGPSTMLLRSLQSRFADSTTFWAYLQRSAYDARQGEIILESSEQLYLMQPTNAVAANNFAAALLTKRVRSEEALKITEGLYRRFSRNPAVRINQASALIRNARLDEALPILQSLDGAEMSDSEKTFTRLAWFEYYEARGEADRALAEAKKVEKRFLFQDQQEWLTGRMAKLDGL